MCAACDLHLRFFAIADTEQKSTFCHDKCDWTRTILALPQLNDTETVGAAAAGRPVDKLTKQVRARLHHQCLVEFKAKALPENLELPIKSLDQLSTFLKSRISLTPDPRIVTPPLDAAALLTTISTSAADSDDKPKKRGRPRKLVDANGDKIPDKPAPPPADRVSRETSRLLALDSSCLDVIMTHPVGYSPRSILFSAERSLNRSGSVNRSVSFSGNDTFIEAQHFDDDSDDDSTSSGDELRECSRSPGSPVPTKRRCLENEVHPKKLVSPSKVSSPPPPSSPSVLSSSKKASKSPKSKTPKSPKPASKRKSTDSAVKPAKTNGSSTNGRSPPEKAPKKISTSSPPKQQTSPEIKIKLAALLHGLGSKTKKKQRQPQPSLAAQDKKANKRLQQTYLKKKFGARFLCSQVLVERVKQLAAKRRHAAPADWTTKQHVLADEAQAIDHEVEMICPSGAGDKDHKQPPMAAASIATQSKCMTNGSSPAEHVANSNGRFVNENGG